MTDQMFVSLDQAATRYGVSTRTVRRWIDRGDIPGYKLGGLLKLKDSDLEVFEAAHVAPVRACISRRQRAQSGKRVVVKPARHLVAVD